MDIVVHHTGVVQNSTLPLAAKLRNLQAFSQREEALAGLKKHAWPDLPYHFYIDWTGAVAEGRDLLFEGDSNTRYQQWGHVQVV
jgi:hypothetical protein